MFSNNGTSFTDCQAVPVINGEAACTVTYGAGGQYLVKAEYLGSLGYKFSVSAGYTETVAVSTALSMLSLSNPAPIGRPVTYIATLSPAADIGTVRFTNDGATVAGCGAVPIGTGRATCTTTYLSGGWPAHRPGCVPGLAGIPPVELDSLP